LKLKKLSDGKYNRKFKTIKVKQKMKIVEVQFTPLSKPYWFNPENHDLKVGNQIIVKTDLGIEMGKVTALKDISQGEIDEREIKPVIRKANSSDLEKAEEKNKHKGDDLNICRSLIEKQALDMKITDVHYSFDGGRITFYFTASGRIDFRALVKELTHHFQKSIRLYQIGVRDEARTLGTIGPCGKKLCCKLFLNQLNQINTGYSHIQQISHRGQERLSGICGRLKCCLRFEQKTYETLAKNLPLVGSSINTPQGKGKVTKQHVLKQAVEVQLDSDPETNVEIKI